MKNIIIIFLGLAALVTLLIIADKNFDHAPQEFSSEGYVWNTDEDPVDSKDENETETQKETAVDIYDFTVVDEDGNNVKRSDFIGKPMVVLFWQSGYESCRQELAAFRECYAEYSNDVVFMAVCIVDGQNETMESANEFLQNNQFEFPIYFDVYLEVNSKYDLSYRTHLFTKDGVLYKRTSNVISTETLEEGIEMILH